MARIGVRKSPREAAETSVRDLRTRCEQQNEQEHAPAHVTSFGWLMGPRKAFASLHRPCGEYCHRVLDFCPSKWGTPQADRHLAIDSGTILALSKGRDRPSSAVGPRFHTDVRTSASPRQRAFVQGSCQLRRRPLRSLVLIASDRSPAYALRYISRYSTGQTLSGKLKLCLHVSRTYISFERVPGTGQRRRLTIMRLHQFREQSVPAIGQSAVKKQF